MYLEQKYKTNLHNNKDYIIINNKIRFKRPLTKGFCLRLCSLKYKEHLHKTQSEAS